jgi:Alpha/beta hydrolase of unknown function (DUF900)
MLIFTNRKVQHANDASAFTLQFQPGSDQLGMAQVERDAAGFLVSNTRSVLTDDAAMKLLVPVFQGDKSILVYLHGNNNPPSSCFERCARLGEIYGVEVIGFSWPSEGYLSSGDDLPNMAAADLGRSNDPSLATVTSGNRKEGWADRKIRRYRQAKVNAQDSGDALARFLRLIAAARLYSNHQRVSIAAHSLGCHFIQYAIESDGAAESLSAAYNIALLAACCRAEGHANWVNKLTPKGKVFVTYNQSDLVLYGAYIADSQQTKLGTEPGSRIIDSKVRYVSFSGGHVGLHGHGYFVCDLNDTMQKSSKKVFGRIFSSEQDIREYQGEYARQVYPVGCDANGSTCYMAKPPA